MRTRVLVVIAVLFTSALPAFADKTGNDVLNSCQTAVRFFDNDGAPAGEHFDSGWCIGWVSGVLQLTKAHNDWSRLVEQKPTAWQFCVPASGIPVIQGVRIVVKYLKEHPEQLHEDGMGLTVAALKDSFPCR